MDAYFQLFMKPRWRGTFSLQDKDAEKATEIINMANGRKDVYRSIYNYVGSVDGRNAIIDKIYIDLDPDEEVEGRILVDSVLEDTRTLHNYLYEHDIKHSIFFSGRGMHVYIFTYPTFAHMLNSPSNSIRRYVDKIIEELGIKIDWQVVGDLRRVSRMPNTVNLKTGLFCIPISREDLMKSAEEIEEIAKKSQSTSSLYGKSLVDLTSYDNDEVYSGLQIEAIDGPNLYMGDLKLPLCVEQSLKRGDSGYRERYAIITCLRDLAFSEDDVIHILEEHLIPEKFNHCVFEEKQVEYLFSKQSLLFPNCETIKFDGFCVKGCPGQRIYY